VPIIIPNAAPPAIPTLRRMTDGEKYYARMERQSVKWLQRIARLNEHLKRCKAGAACGFCGGANRNGN